MLSRRKILLVAPALVLPKRSLAFSPSMQEVLFSKTPVNGSGVVSLDQFSFNNPANGAWTHTPIGTPTAVGVFINSYASDTTAVTYGGVSMAPVFTSIITDGGGDTHQSIWGLANPPAGAQTISVTMTFPQFSIAACVTVTGSDKTTCFRASSGPTNKGNSTTPSVVETVSAVGDLIVDVVGQQNNGALPNAVFSTTGSNSIIGTSQALVSAGMALAISQASGSNSNVTMSWSSTKSLFWANCCASFKHA